MAETAAMADLIKASWPSAIIYQNEAPGIGDCNYNRLNETVFTEQHPMVPASVDWWGYDSYAFDNSSWLRPIAAYEVRERPADQPPPARVCWADRQALCSQRNVFPRLVSPPSLAAVATTCWSSHDATVAAQHPHQRVVHVTTAFADPGYGERANESAADIDAFCVANAEAFLAWALQEPRVAAVRSYKR